LKSIHGKGLKGLAKAAARPTSGQLALSYPQGSVPNFTYLDKQQPC